MSVKLIDIFHGDTVDWQKVKNAGVSGCYVKCTDGQHTVDPMWQAHAAAARTFLKRVGLYHYLEYDSSVDAQVALFLNTVGGRAGLVGMLPPALDVEGDRNNTIPKSDRGEYAKLALGWLQAVEHEIGCKPFLYTYKSFIDEHLTTQLDGLTKYPLWISSTGNNHPAGSPATVTGWGNKWLMHQYSTTGGDGIPVPDQDVFNGSLAALDELIIRAGQKIKVIRHSTGEKIAEYIVVENGDHINDSLHKLFVV